MRQKWRIYGLSDSEAFIYLAMTRIMVARLARARP